MEILLKRVYGEDGRFQYEELLNELPNGGNGGEVVSANFVPVLKLQSASEQPSGGNLLGKYRIAPGIVHLSYLLVWNSDFIPGTPSGSGTSRYYFPLPDEVPEISGNIAEHGSVRMFDGSKEYSGVPSLYNSINRAVIAEVNGERWGVSTPFPLNKISQYISLGIWWLI
jgi:hypothetical protein